MLCEMETKMLVDSGESQKLDPNSFLEIYSEYIQSHFSRSLLYFDKQEKECIGVSNFSYSLDPFSFISSDLQSIFINKKFRGQKLYPKMHKFVIDYSVKDGATKFIWYFYFENQIQLASIKKHGLDNFGR